MSFLQPWLIAALPLVALPVMIHLINQRRFQTIRWAAMMFLLSAQRMARGYSRLRQWLIMFFRTLVVAGLVLAVSRPLASGWLGSVAGGKADTTIVLVDRSPSMQEQAAGGGLSKLETGLAQLGRVLGTFRSDRWVLIDSATREPVELESPAALLSAPTAGAASAGADLPLLLQSAHDYIKKQQTGRTEVWICSDLRTPDWAPDHGRWRALRDAFVGFPQGVRFHLLAYPQRAAGNVAVRVTGAKRHTTKEGVALLVSVKLSRSSGEEKLDVPLQFEIDGGRSVLHVELAGSQAEVRDHRIPLEASRKRGFGRVSIPADANPADNEFFFVFDDPPPRKTLIIADDSQAAAPLELAASISADEAPASVEVLAAEQLSGVAWDQTSLVLWQAPLPTGNVADLLQSFVDNGGQVVFFPPREPTQTEAFGLRWESWVDDVAPVESWRGDAALLARPQSGAALPVGELEVHRHCELRGEYTGLSMLRGGQPLLARVPSDRGGVYFWTTTPAMRDSTLATNGVVLYAFVQRALAAGSSALGSTRSIDAGNFNAGEDASEWKRLIGGTDGLSTEATAHAGVYAAGERMLAVNRPLAEDDTRIVPEATVAELFRGLDFTRVDDRPGNASSLIEEIWRAFLMLMLVAMMLEAALCLPKLARPQAVAAQQIARAAA